MTHRDAGYREGIEAAAKVHVGVDYGGKDTTGLTLRKGATVFSFFGEEAEIIAKALEQAALPLPSTPDDGKAEPVGYVRAHFAAALGGLGLTTVYAEKHKLEDDVPVYLNSSPASDGAIREALTDAFDAIKTLPVDALGFANDDASQWSIRDELLAKMGNALSAHAGDAAKSGGVIEVGPFPGEDDNGNVGIASGPPDTHAEVKG